LNRDDFEFLSKDGKFVNGDIHMTRKIERVLLGSHLTESVPKNLTKDEYHSCVTLGL
jgi:hypothetical protein